MFCAHKNSYLQKVFAINPRVINKAVDLAMCRLPDGHDTEPVTQRMESMQPSLYAPQVDVSHARLGFGRIGLRIIIRDLHSKDFLVQLQSLHSIMDQVQISENALYLLQLHLVYRLIDLFDHRSPIVIEKLCIILTHLANYYQGRKQILSRPIIIKRLLAITINERRELRYVAANALKTLAKDRCSAEAITKCENIIPNLLKIVTQDFRGIVVMHLKTLRNLIEWEPLFPLKCNAFQVMLSLFDEEAEIAYCAMDCMAQLLKHPFGRELSDKNDLNFKLRPFLNSDNIEIIMSVVSLMQVTTLTTASKWRAKEICVELTERLVELCHCPNKPIIQLCCMQVLINLCDCPDIRNYVKTMLENKIMDIYIRNHEEWDGTSETTTYCFETGFNRKTMVIEGVNNIKDDCGMNASVVNVHSYVRTLNKIKQKLIKAINWKCYRD